MYMAGQEQLLAGMNRQNALLEEIAVGQKELINLIREDGGLGSGAAAAAASAKKTKKGSSMELDGLQVCYSAPDPFSTHMILVAAAVTQLQISGCLLGSSPQVCSGSRCLGADRKAS